MADGNDRRDGKDLVLPAFEMDCRDWLVVGPAEAGKKQKMWGPPAALGRKKTNAESSDLPEF